MDGQREEGGREGRTEGARERASEGGEGREGRTEEGREGLRDGWMHGRMDGWTHGRKERWMTLFPVFFFQTFQGSIGYFPTHDYKTGHWCSSGEPRTGLRHKAW